MNKRHIALDGLRGFAALSVFFAHVGFNINALTNIPLLIIAYNTLAVGTNAVQILFVLSGFLMAYLYSEETHPLHFIRKRYTRIFPVYIVIITYIWITSLSTKITWYENLFILFLVALFFFIIWKTVRKFDSNGRIRSFIFFGFISLQILCICLLTLSQSHFIHSGQIEYPVPLIWLANITLTTDFVSGLTRLLNQAWSLVPEVLFYITFPFITIPLINITKKWGIFVGVIIVVVMTKIFFDLDTAFYSYADLQSINIARASGFIAGVVIGVIYKSQGKLWNFFEKIYSHSVAGILSFAIFLYIQWKIGDSIATGNASIPELNLYYLLSSWIIILLIVAVILPQTVMNKFFGHKTVAFFGIISYSVYLIHTNIIQLSLTITPLLKHLLISPMISNLFYFLFALTLTIIVSYLLFKYIESLYFLDKKHMDNKALTKTAEEKQIKQKVMPIRIVGAGIIFCLLIIIIYSGNFAFSLAVNRNPEAFLYTKRNSEISLDKKPFFMPIVAKNQNLSEIVILLRYANTSGYTMDTIKQHRQLVFKLYDKNKDKILFESKRDAMQVNGQLRFPFGFPSQINSQNKKYIIELTLAGQSNGENVYINTSTTSFVSVYTNPPTSKIKMLPTFLLNRIFFASSNPDAQFALLFLVFVIALQLFPDKIYIFSYKKASKALLPAISISTKKIKNYKK